MYDRDEIEKLRAQVQELKHALQHARHLIIHVSPTSPEAWRLLRFTCKSKQEWRQWQRDTINKLLELTVDDRTCPLCGQRFTPVSLRWHLDDSHRMSRCSVFQAAIDLVHDGHIEEWRANEIQENIAGLAPVMELCKADGVNCQVYTNKHNNQAYLTGPSTRRSYSVIFWEGGDRFQVQASNGCVELFHCSAEDAAHALIWEHQNPLKRWMKDRG